MTCFYSIKVLIEKRGVYAADTTGHLTSHNADVPRVKKAVRLTVSPTAFFVGKPRKNLQPILVQKMMTDAVLFIGDHGAEIHVGDAFEDVCLDLRI